MRNLIGTFLFLLFTNAYGQSIVSTIPTSFSHTQPNLGAKGTGYSCLSFTTILDSLPCQPAYIALVKEPSFTTQISIGNGYQALSTADNLLNRPVSREFLKSLFNENRVLEMEGNGSLYFKAPNFGASFTPYKVNYLSVIRNEAYPTIGVHAMQEKILAFQGGLKVTNGLYTGVQLRTVERKFIHKQFTLFDVLAEDGDKVIQPKDQKALFIEPGVSYFLPMPWKPRVSLLLSNLGYVDQKYPEIDNSPNLQTGFGIQPPLKYGTLELGIDYKKLKQDSEFTERFYYGGAYTLGAMQLTGGFNADNYNGGVLFSLNAISVGIIYSSTRVPGGSDDGAYTQTVYTQFGFQM